MAHASESEARAFAAAFLSFLEWVHTDAGEPNEVVALIADYLGAGAADQSVVTRSLPAFEHAFTHYRLTMHPLRLRVRDAAQSVQAPERTWMSTEQAAAAALPRSR